MLSANFIWQFMEMLTEAKKKNLDWLKVSWIGKMRWEKCGWGFSGGKKGNHVIMGSQSQSRVSVSCPGTDSYN
jgi:hypothetical protein